MVRRWRIYPNWVNYPLYEPVSIPHWLQRGRKRLKGARLRPLVKVADDKTTAWQKLEVADWYGGKSQTVDYVTGTTLWYHTGKKPVAIRWVLIRLENKLTGLVSNGPGLRADEMIGYFVHRWSMETTAPAARVCLSVSAFGCRKAATMEWVGYWSYYPRVNGFIFIGYLIGRFTPKEGSAGLSGE